MTALKTQNAFVGIVAVLAASIPFCLGAQAADSDYAWKLPPGFPRPAVPDSNPMSQAKVELGCRLFFEPRLSATGNFSCASCHRPELAFTDARALAVGATGSTMTRGSMSLANAAYNPALTWGNDRLATLEEQMEQPLFNEHPIEMGQRRDGAVLAELVRTDPSYDTAFRSVFAGEENPASLPSMIRAIAAFERTLISGRSAFDRYVYDDDRSALSESARAGMALFYSERTRCGHCHAGITFSGAIRHGGDDKPVVAAFASNGSYRGGEDAGLKAVTGKAGDLGKFRVPTLRNVAVTAPYMHDGSLASLTAVIDHYDAGGGHDAARFASLDPAIRTLQLNAEEKRALVAFLESLTDPQFLARDYRKCSAE